jgi:mannose-1-phosphate guanylyltransferase
MPKDEQSNATNCDSTILLDTQNSMVHLPKGKVALIKGLSDYIVVDDGKVLMIVPKSDEQSIKQWSKQISDNFGKEYC